MKHVKNPTDLQLLALPVTYITLPDNDIPLSVQTLVNNTETIVSGEELISTAIKEQV